MSPRLFVYKILRLRNKVLLIAYRIDSKQLDELGNRNCETSDYKTSFDGNKKLKYIDVPVEKFHVIGTLDTSIATLAQNIVLAANTARFLIL